MPLNHMRAAESQYQVGLNQKEDVISAHFMHAINQDSHLYLYNEIDFCNKALLVSAQLVFLHLIPALLDSSNKLIIDRACAAKLRAKQNFKEYGLQSARDIDLAENITEVMFDRQFLKGSKSNMNRLFLCKQIKNLLNQNKSIKMVIPALPFKSSSPLKTRGDSPDLSEVNFLLSLVEIAKTIEYICIEMGNKQITACFTIICDGKRFNHFLNESDQKIEHYKNQLSLWIKKLNIEKYIEIIDYQKIISLLPKTLQLEKLKIKDQVRKEYTKIMNAIFNPNDMPHTIQQAIRLDPDPFESHHEGRFIPLFKSLIYIIRYEKLLKYTHLHQCNYKELYITLTQHIFEPFISLSVNEMEQVKQFISNPKTKIIPTHVQILECLRQTMLEEAWNATVEYISEIKSDRDLSQEPITTCMPDHIRWTIHAKPGQLAILTTTANGDPIQPWHGVGVFKLSKSNKIKLYTLPTLSLEGKGAIPVIFFNENTWINETEELCLFNQPLFYIYPDIKFKNIEDFFNKIKKHITRTRKF